MRLYFAGPLFSDAERAFNLELTAQIEDLAIEVFLPQRDGIEGDRPPYDELPREERRALMFATDRDEILACDVFLFITDGRVPDEGAAVELGLAYAHRHLTGCSRLLVGLRTDTRAAFIAGPLNPMIGQALDTVCESRTELLALLHPDEHLYKSEEADEYR
jgi:nucleoside 2-deoxyribosyltransferase